MSVAHAATTANGTVATIPTNTPMPISSATPAVTLTGSATLTPTAVGVPRTGDCNDDRQVTIDELIAGVNIALGSLPVSACQAFENAHGTVDIAQLIKGVDNALNGCGALLTVAK